MADTASEHFGAETEGRSRGLVLGSSFTRLFCVLMLLGALAGCGSGSAPARHQTAGPTARPGAAATSVGGLELQFVRIERPSGDAHVVGSDVGLYLTIVNRRRSVDRLTAVTSPDATRVVVRDGVNSPARPVDLQIPEQATLNLQHPDRTHLELADLKRELRPGEFVSVAFSFEHAGSVTLNVPVQVTSHPLVPSPTSSRSG